MNIALRQHRERGFTLIELLFTVALIGVLVAIAVPSFASFISSYRATAAVNDLLQAMVQARSEALKQSRRVIVVPNNTSGTPSTSGSWANGWTIFADRNNNQVFDSSTETVIFSHGKLSPTTTFLAPNGAPAAQIFGSTNYVIFDGTGYPRTSAITGSLGGVQITDNTGSTPQKRTLCLALLGRPRIINGTDPCS